MAFSRTQSVITYTSSGGGVSYQYDIAVDAASKVQVRNVRGPRGLVRDSMTGLPESVVDDITRAVDYTQLLLAESAIVSGDEEFTGQVSRTVAILPGLLNNIAYRVYALSEDAIPIRVENRTTTSFDLVLPAAYGAVDAPKEVSWVVYTSTSALSASGGLLTFSFADGGLKEVDFPTALLSADYRVLVEPSDFFPVQITNKTRAGFSVQLGVGLQDNGETVTVGYDVVV